MKSFEKPFFSLTVADLMSRHVVTIPQDMSLRAAAHLLSEEAISGAPVVDGDGRCVGVLSSTDFVCWTHLDRSAGPRRKASEVSCEWQLVNMEDVPAAEVIQYMTADPVTASPTTSIASLAGMMRNAHIHRVIVVDSDRRPVGIVTSTDILAAVAQADPIRDRIEELSLQSS